MHLSTTLLTAALLCPISAFFLPQRSLITTAKFGQTTPPPGGHDFHSLEPGTRRPVPDVRDPRWVPGYVRTHPSLPTDTVISGGHRQRSDIPHYRTLPEHPGPRRTRIVQEGQQTSGAKARRRVRRRPTTTVVVTGAATPPVRVTTTLSIAQPTTQAAEAGMRAVYRNLLFTLAGEAQGFDRLPLPIARYEIPEKEMSSGTGYGAASRFAALVRKDPTVASTTTVKSTVTVTHTVSSLERYEGVPESTTRMASYVAATGMAKPVSHASKPTSNDSLMPRWTGTPDVHAPQRPKTTAGTTSSPSTASYAKSTTCFETATK